MVPNDTAVAAAEDNPIVKIGTDTEISQDGSTKIVSDLEIHPYTMLERGQQVLRGLRDHRVWKDRRDQLDPRDHKDLKVTTCMHSLDPRPY